MNLELTTPLGALVVARPDLGPVLEGLGIDYCCGGQRTLAEAAREGRLDPATLVRTLAAVPPPDASAKSPYPRVDQLTTPELLDHIVSTHHTYVRTHLPRLGELTQKVARAHGADHPELVDLAAAIPTLESALLSHLLDEENVLFPLLRSFDSALLGTAHGALEPYIDEHEDVGALLASFRVLTGNFARPEWACSTYHLLMSALEEFEADLHQHIHLENNVLFPRFKDGRR